MAESKAVKNGLWNVLSTMGVIVVSIGGSVLIVRTLSTEQYGTFQYYTWLAGIIGRLGILAFPKSLTKIASELRGKNQSLEAKSLAFIVSVGVTLINVGLFAVILLIVNNRGLPERNYLLIIGGTLVFHGLSRVLTSAFWAFERYSNVTRVNAFAVLTQMVLIICAFIFGWGVAGFLLAILSYHVITAIFLFGDIIGQELHHFELRQLTFDRSVLRRYLTFSWPATLIVVFQAIVWQRSEVFFLERFSTLEAIGYYGLAFTIYGVFLSLGWALVNGYQPAMSFAFGEGDNQKISVSLSQGVVLSALFALPITFGCLALLSPLLVGIYGAAMEPAAYVAQILILPLTLGVVVELFSHTIAALDKQWVIVRIGLVMAVINIALNFALIPSFGATGAAISNSFSQAFFALCLFFALRSTIETQLPWRVLAKLLGISFLTAYCLPVVLYTLFPSLLGLFFAIMCSAISFILLCAYGRLFADSGLSSVPALASFFGKNTFGPRESLRVVHVLGNRKLPRDPDAAAISGVVKMALEIAQEQSELGYEVCVVSVGNEAWHSNWKGIEVRMLRTGWIPKLRIRKRVLFNTRIFLPYFLFTHRRSFDVMHSHLFTYQRFFKATVKVVHYHTDPLHRGMAGKDISLKSNAASIILDNSDAQLAVSKFVADRLKSRLGEASNIHVIRNAIDLERFRAVPEGRSAIREQHNLPVDAVSFLYAGAIVPEKGVLELAQAFTRLCEKSPKDVHLLIAGSRSLWGGGSTEDSHAAYEKSVNLALAKPIQRGKVSFLGLIPSFAMPAVYAAADVVVVPSIWNEAFGLVALEACASGKPVIGTNTGGLGELITLAHQIQVPPKDVGALFEAMLLLSVDTAIRKAKGLEACEVSQHFSLRAVVVELDCLYKSLLERKVTNRENIPA